MQQQIGPVQSIVLKNPASRKAVSSKENRPTVPIPRIRDAHFSLPVKDANTMHHVASTLLLLQSRDPFLLALTWHIRAMQSVPCNLFFFQFMAILSLATLCWNCITYFLSAEARFPSFSVIITFQQGSSTNSLRAFLSTLLPDLHSCTPAQSACKTPSQLEMKNTHH